MDRALVLANDRVAISMSNLQKETQTHQWQDLTLAQYVEHHNGVPLGDGQSLRNMLQRSFGAASFAGFWQYWNPIWGYGLGNFVYAPLQRVLPPVVAFILTFVVSGGMHDLATMAVSRRWAFLVTLWFFLLGMGAVLGRALEMDLAQRPWWVRASIHFAYLLLCFALALLVKREMSL